MTENVYMTCVKNVNHLKLKMGKTHGSPCSYHCRKNISRYSTFVKLVNTFIFLCCCPAVKQVIFIFIEAIRPPVIQGLFCAVRLEFFDLST